MGVRWDSNAHCAWDIFLEKAAGMIANDGRIRGMILTTLDKDPFAQDEVDEEEVGAPVGARILHFSSTPTPPIQLSKKRKHRRS